MTNVVTLQSVLEHHRSHALMVTRFRHPGVVGDAQKKALKTCLCEVDRHLKKKNRKRHKALVFALKSKTGDEGSKLLSHRL